MNNYGFKKTFNDLSGKVFGLWTVVRLAPRNKKREEQWLCRCRCGTERVIATYDLKHGRTYGCIKCAAKEGRIGHKFNPKKYLDRAVAAIRTLVNNGYPFNDVLERLDMERNKIQ